LTSLFAEVLSGKSELLAGIYILISCVYRQKEEESFMAFVA